MLEHVEDDRRLLENIHRVLIPGGIVVILVPINEIYFDPNHVRKYTSLGMKSLAKDCGFDVQYQIENELLFHLVEKF